MANNNQDSKQTKNIVEVIGLVKENKIEKTKDLIKGSLVIAYGKKPFQQTEVNVYADRMKIDKETREKVENKNYDKLVKLADLVSMVNATDEQPASKVRIYGRGNFAPNIRLNEYYNENNDNVVSNVQISLGFGNVYEDENLTQEQFKSEFDVVVFLHKTPKMDKKTGNLQLECLYVDYNNAVKPITLVVEDEDLIDAISECEKGQTVNFWGECQVANIEETKTKKSAFGGKAKTDTKIYSQRKLVVQGGDYVSENEELDLEFVKKALSERELYLENLKNKKKSTSITNKPKGFAGAGSKRNDALPF